MEGKCLVGVEFGVNRTGTLVIELFGQYKFSGAAAPPSSVGDLTLRRNRKGGALVHMSVRQRNSGEESSQVLQMTRDLYGKWAPRARARALSPAYGPARARFSLKL
jgi:hypothetical protein